LPESTQRKYSVGTGVHLAPYQWAELGVIGACLIFTGYQGVKALQQWYHMSQKAGALYKHMPGATVRGLPKPHPSVASTVPEIKMYKDYQLSKGYHWWLKATGEAGISPQDKLFINNDKLLFEAYQRAAYAGDYSTANAIIRSVSAGFYGGSRRVFDLPHYTYSGQGLASPDSGHIVGQGGLPGMPHPRPAPPSGTQPSSPYGVATMLPETAQGIDARTMRSLIDITSFIQATGLPTNQITPQLFQLFVPPDMTMTVTMPIVAQLIGMGHMPADVAAMSPEQMYTELFQQTVGLPNWDAANWAEVLKELSPDLPEHPRGGKVVAYIPGVGTWVMVGEDPVALLFLPDEDTEAWWNSLSFEERKRVLRERRIGDGYAMDTWDRLPESVRNALTAFGEEEMTRAKELGFAPPEFQLAYNQQEHIARKLLMTIEEGLAAIEPDHAELMSDYKEKASLVERLKQDGAAADIIAAARKERDELWVEVREEKAIIEEQQEMAVWLKKALDEAILSEGEPMPLYVQRQFLEEAHSLLPSASDTDISPKLKQAPIADGYMLIRTGARDQILAAATVRMRDQREVLSKIVKDKGLPEADTSIAISDILKHVEKHDVAWPPMSEMSPEGRAMYENFVRRTMERPTLAEPTIQTFADLKRVIEERKDWSIISAAREETPEGEKLTPTTNRIRMEGLQAALRAEGYEFYDVMDVYKGVGEEAVLVLDIDPFTARRFGSLYNQESILHPSLGFVYEDYSTDPVDISKLTWKVSPEQDHTSIAIGDKTYRFAIPEEAIQWGAKRPIPKDDFLRSWEGFIALLRQKYAGLYISIERKRNIFDSSFYAEGEFGYVILGTGDIGRFAKNLVEEDIVKRLVVLHEVGHHISGYRIKGDPLTKEVDAWKFAVENATRYGIPYKDAVAFVRKMAKVAHPELGKGAILRQLENEGILPAVTPEVEATAQAVEPTATPFKWTLYGAEAPRTIAVTPLATGDWVTFTDPDGNVVTGKVVSSGADGSAFMRQNPDRMGGYTIVTTKAKHVSPPSGVVIKNLGTISDTRLVVTHNYGKNYQVVPPATTTAPAVEPTATQEGDLAVAEVPIQVREGEIEYKLQGITPIDDVSTQELSLKPITLMNTKERTKMGLGDLVARLEKIDETKLSAENAGLTSQLRDMVSKDFKGGTLDRSAHVERILRMVSEAHPGEEGFEVPEAILEAIKVIPYDAVSWQDFTRMVYELEHPDKLTTERFATIDPEGKVEDRVQALMNQLGFVPPPPDTPHYQAEGKFDAARAKFGGLLVRTYRMERILEHLDRYAEKQGLPAGIFMKTFWEPITGASNQKLRLMHDEYTSFRELVKREGINMKKIWGEKKPMLKEYPDWKMTPSDRIAVYMLNQNRQGQIHLIYGNKLSEENIQNLISQMTPDEHKVAQWMQESFARIYPLVNSTYEQMHGRSMGHIENFFPLMLTPRGLSEVGMERQVALDTWLRDFAKKAESGIHKGFTKERLAAGFQEVKLDAMTTYLNYLQSAAHYAAYAGVIRDLSIVARNPKFREGFIETQGQAKYDVLRTWLVDVAKTNPLKVDRVADGVLRWVRVNTVTAVLGLNITTALKQFASFFGGMAEIGEPAAMQGLFSYLAHPKNTRALQEQYSPEIFHRVMEREVGEMKLAQSARKKLLGKITPREVYMFMTLGMDKLAVNSLWQGAFDKYQKDYPDATIEQAADYATRVIRKTQPFFAIKDVPEFWRSGEAMKALTIFTNQLNQYWNYYIYDIFGKIKYGKGGELPPDGIAPGAPPGESPNQPPFDKPDSLVDMLRKIFWMIVVPAYTIGAIARSRVSQNKEELAQDLGSQFLAPAPILGNWLAPVIRDSYQDSGTIHTKMFYTMYSLLNQMATEDPDWAKTALTGTELGAYMLGVPFVQPRRTLTGLYDLLEGETDDWLRLIWSEHAREQQAGIPESAKIIAGKLSKKEIELGESIEGRWYTLGRYGADVLSEYRDYGLPYERLIMGGSLTELQKFRLACELQWKEYVRLQTSKERLAYRAENPVVDATLFFWENVSTLRSREAIPVVMTLFKEYEVFGNHRWHWIDLPEVPDYVQALYDYRLEGGFMP